MDWNHDMINQEDLLALLGDLESDRVERTESTKDTDKFAEAVTAFANDWPGHRLTGYLMIGVKNDGRLSGLKVTDTFLTSLGGLRSDGNIQPLPAISVVKFNFPEGDVAVVEVLPSDLPPVRYKGRVWIRVGPRKATASEQEERILTERRTARARTFDAQPCLESGLADLDSELFRNTYLSQAVAPEVIAGNHRDMGTQLASLRFFDSTRACPTNAGMLLFGKNPLHWLPGAYIQFLRVNGETLADEVASEKRLSGDLLTVLRALDSLVDLLIESHPVADSALRERMTTDYPKVAIRELLLNAVMHRSYESNSPIRFYWFSDHVEIQNPGGLYGDASPENFPNQNSYRNPILAEAMKTLGYVNKFGRGVDRAQEALSTNGNPRAEFRFDQHYVQALLKVKR